MTARAREEVISPSRRWQNGQVIRPTERSVPTSAQGAAGSTTADGANPHKGRTGLDRIVRATVYSAQGLSAAYRTESAFRQEVWLTVVALPLAFWLGRQWIEVILLIGSLLLLLIAELLNSAIEATVDRVSLDIHELAKRAKDYGSAAVFIALLLCAGVWLTVAWQRWQGA